MVRGTAQPFRSTRNRQRVKELSFSKVYKSWEEIQNQHLGFGAERGKQRKKYWGYWLPYTLEFVEADAGVLGKNGAWKRIGATQTGGAAVLVRKGYVSHRGS